MFRQSSWIALCAVLLTGCTSSGTADSDIPIYDQFDLVVWEKCMDWAIAQNEGFLSYNKGDNKFDLQQALKMCDSAVPKPLNK